MRPLIGYVRVSTSKQGKSGLGIEAQQEVLSRFAEAEGFELLRVFVEVETGKGSDALERTRPTSCRSSGKSSPQGPQRCARLRRPSMRAGSKRRGADSGTL
jgi:hypothetical protein